VEARIIDDEAEFQALAAPWQALARDCGARPFQDFDWASAWLRTIGTARGYRPRVVTLWDGSRLRGVLPLAYRQYRAVRLLEWMGARVSDYCDALIDPAIERRAALHALWRSLNGHGGFDVIRLGQVPAGAAANELCHGVEPWIETTDTAHAIPLRWRSGADWLKHQSSKANHRVRYGLRRMARLGFEFHVWQAPEPMAPLLDALIEQKRAWLAARHVEDHLLQEPEGRAFVHASAEALAADGSLHLSVLRSRDHIAACHLGFFRNGTYYYYMPTYDAAFAKYSFGTLLLDSLIMWACDHGAQRFDMLIGAHGYKQHYGAVSETVRTLVVGRSLLGKAAVQFYRASTTRARKSPAVAQTPLPLY
jgi:CelD/BcsL family acetyltransferase involved in cellulose biosynthesis